MGRRKIDISPIGDERMKRVTMKKRRIGLLKKAIQLSKLTDARIYLKIFTPQDKLLLEYISKVKDPILKMDQTSPEVKSYAKYSNDDYSTFLKIKAQNNLNMGHKENDSAEKNDQNDVTSESFSDLSQNKRKLIIQMQGHGDLENKPFQNNKYFSLKNLTSQIQTPLYSRGGITGSTFPHNLTSQNDINALTNDNSHNTRSMSHSIQPLNFMNRFQFQQKINELENSLNQLKQQTERNDQIRMSQFYENQMKIQNHLNPIRLQNSVLKTMPTNKIPVLLNMQKQNPFQVGLGTNSNILQQIMKTNTQFQRNGQNDSNFVNKREFKQMSKQLLDTNPLQQLQQNLKQNIQVNQPNLQKIQNQQLEQRILYNESRSFDSPMFLQENDKNKVKQRSIIISKPNSNASSIVFQNPSQQQFQRSLFSQPPHKMEEKQKVFVVWSLNSNPKNPTEITDVLQSLPMIAQQPLDDNIQNNQNCQQNLIGNH